MSDVRAFSIPSQAEVRETLGKLQRGRSPSEEIAEAKSNARRSGFDEGFEAGRRTGFERGKEEGFSAGHDEATAEVRAEFAARIERLQGEFGELVADLERARADHLQEVERTLSGLAVEIARRAVAAELQTAPEHVLEIAREALAETREGAHVRLRANLADRDLLREHLDELARGAAHVESIEFVADDKIEGGVVVDSDLGAVDARVQTYLARIAEKVRS